MRLIQSITGQRNSLLREVGRRYFSAVSTEEYARRNYASNVSEYNTVIGSLTAQRRHFLLRDVYDDMMLDGVQPTRDTFHSFIVGTMKSSCLQDTFYFSDQMKSMGLVPDMNSVTVDLRPKCLVIDEIDGVLGDGKGAVEVILKMVSADKKSDTRKENFPNEENHESIKSVSILVEVSRMLLMLPLKFGIIPIVVPVGVRDFDIDGEHWVNSGLIPTEAFVGVVIFSRSCNIL